MTQEHYLRVPPPCGGDTRPRAAAHVFKCNRPRCAFGLRHDLFTEVVIHPGCEATFLSRQLPQAAATTERAALLELVAQPPVSIAHVRNRLAAEHLPIAIHGDVRHPKVNTQRLACGLWGGFWSLTGGKQVPVAIPIAQVALALLGGQQRPLTLATDEGDYLPSVACPDGHRSGGKVERKGLTIEGQRTQGGKAARGALIQLIGVGHFGDTADGDLGRQAEGVSGVVGDQLVQGELPECLGFPGRAVNGVTRRVGRLQGAPEGVGLCRGGSELDLGGEFHRILSARRAVTCRGWQHACDGEGRVIRLGSRHEQRGPHLPQLFPIDQLCYFNAQHAGDGSEQVEINQLYSFAVLSAVLCAVPVAPDRPHRHGLIKPLGYSGVQRGQIQAALSRLLLNPQPCHTHLLCLMLPTGTLYHFCIQKSILKTLDIQNFVYYTLSLQHDGPRRCYEHPHGPNHRREYLQWLPRFSTPAAPRVIWTSAEVLRHGSKDYEARLDGKCCGFYEYSFQDEHELGELLHQEAEQLAAELADEAAEREVEATPAVRVEPCILDDSNFAESGRMVGTDFTIGEGKAEITVYVPLRPDAINTISILAFRRHEISLIEFEAIVAAVKVIQADPRYRAALVAQVAA